MPPFRSTAIRLLVPALIVAALAGLYVAPRVKAASITQVDLSTHVRVGRYDLPEPKRTVPPANSLLAQEASGVTFNWDTNGAVCHRRWRHLGGGSKQDRRPCSVP